MSRRRDRGRGRARPSPWTGAFAWQALLSGLPLFPAEPAGGEGGSESRDKKADKKGDDKKSKKGGEDKKAKKGKGGGGGGRE